MRKESKSAKVQGASWRQPSGNLMKAPPCAKFKNEEGGNVWSHSRSLLSSGIKRIEEE